MGLTRQKQRSTPLRKSRSLQHSSRTGPLSRAKKSCSNKGGQRRNGNGREYRDIREALGFNADRVGRDWVVSLALLVQPAAHKDSTSDQSSKSSKESESNEQLTLPRPRLCPRSSGGGSKSSPEEAGANATSGVSTGRSAVGSTICRVVGASVSKYLLGGLGSGYERD